MKITLAEQEFINEDDTNAELFGLLAPHISDIFQPLIEHRRERLVLNVLWRTRPTEKDDLIDHLKNGVDWQSRAPRARLELVDNLPTRYEVLLGSGKIRHLREGLQRLLPILEVLFAPLDRRYRQVMALRILTARPVNKRFQICRHLRRI